MNITIYYSGDITKRENSFQMTFLYFDFKFSCGLHFKGKKRAKDKRFNSLNTSGNICTTTLRLFHIYCRIYSKWLYRILWETWLKVAVLQDEKFSRDG